jgi:acetyltransferase
MPKKYDKPMVTSAFFGPEDHCVETFQKYEIPTFETPEKAAHAMAKLYSYSQIKNQHRITKNKISYKNKEVEKLITKIKNKGQKTLDEFQSKQILSKYGIPTVKENLALSLSEAKEIARKIRYPVVLKGCSDKILHKTEQNMIYLNIKNEEELENGFHAIRSYDKELPVLIQEMLKGEREFMAGMIHFTGFGPFIMFGFGGIFTDVIKDIVFRLSPLDAEESREMLNDIKFKQLLENYRGMEPVDKTLLAEILTKLSEIAIHFADIKEMDLNPIIIVDGKPVVADALILLNS